MDRASLPFAWSHSRQKMLEECPRRYFYAYYAAPLGRTSGLGEEAWLASLLKRLTTLELALGQAIHERAREILQAVRSRRRRPDPGLLLERTRAALNRLCLLSRDRHSFQHATDRRQMLLSLYYGRGLAEGRVTMLRERMHLCLTNLHQSALWDELEAGDPSRIVAVDRVCSFHVGPTLVYVAPDLIYRTTQDGCVICDWKTGSSEGTREQLALYGLYARSGLGISPPGGVYRGRVICLSDGSSEEHVLSEEDLGAASDRVRRGECQMQAYMADAERNVPRGKEAFALTTRRAHCSRCNYLELCASEVGITLACDDSGSATGVRHRLHPAPGHALRPS